MLLPATLDTAMRRLFCLLLLPFLALESLAQSGSFGVAVEVGDGQIIIGEPNTTFREGSVYIYQRGADSWTLTQRLTAPNASRADGFGSALARTGSTLFVGQRNGPLHIFSNDGTSWSHAGALDGPGTAGIDPGCSQYGYCGTDFGLTLAAQGDWLFVGAPGAAPSTGRRARQQQAEPEPGIVQVYRRQADGNWSYATQLQANGGTPADGFGKSILLTDGRALVAAPGWNAPDADRAGRVVEFRLVDGAWTETGSLPVDGRTASEFGASMAWSGDLVAVGAPGTNDSRGVIHLFASAQDGWEQVVRFSHPSVRDGSRLGAGVALAGNDLWVGVPNAVDNETGRVYRYQAPSGSARSVLTLATTVERDEFGRHLIAHDDLLIAMAPGMHHQSGSVHVYERSGAGWSDGHMLVSPPDAIGAIVGEERECTDGRIGPFDCNDVDLLSFVPNSILRAPEHARGVRTNDNWGWTDPETSREYALVGRNDGTSFIDITDPANPVLVGDLPKPWGTPPSQLWRDIKTYQGYAYIVADGAGDHGMQVFDLRRLRDVQNPPELFEPDFHYKGIASSHNIVINEETGFAYAVGNRGGGESCGGGLHMIDIREPLNPVFAGCAVGERGTHDSQCVLYQGPDTRYSGRELCLNSNGAHFAITDVTDKDAPRELARVSSPDAAYIHQGWLTDDHRYFYQDDEADVVRGNVETTRTLVWDLSDVEDPVLVNEFMGSMPASAHNLYLKDGFAYQANYRYGLHVLDIGDPENPVEVGFFDTSPYQEGPGFSGAWSTYPFYESGTVIVTSLQEGLFVLRKKRDVF